jgi:hypothetical protein
MPNYHATAHGLIQLTEEEEIELQERKDNWPTEFQAIQVYKTRDLRNDLLQKSDWTQVADAPVDQAAWATYRQALRDIPAQVGFPSEVTWPTEP